MRIRRQLILSAALFGVMLLVIAALVVTTTAELARLDHQVELADRIGLAANDLNYLSSEYLLYGEPQQLDRWERRYASLEADRSNLSAGSSDQQALIAAIREDQARLRNVFVDVLGQGDPEKLADPATLRVSWSRIGIQTQGVAFDAARLSALFREEADRLQFVNNLLISALLGMFAAALLINYLAVGRRTLRSVGALQAGADAIGGGDIGHTIPAAGDDEMSDLARSFNRMSRDLETVTASRAELEREMASRRLAEQAVREGEQALQSIFRTAPVGIGIESHRTIQSVNAHLCRITGYAPEELVGRDSRMLFPGDEEYARVGKEKVALLHEAGTGATEARLRRKNGSLVDVLLSATPMDPATPLENVVFTVLDITSLHEKEAALRESEAKYRTLFESLDEGFCLIEVLFDDTGAPVDCVFLEANPAFVRQTGLPDAIGKRMRELEPGHEEHWFSIYAEVARTGTPQRFVQAAMPPIGGWYEVYAFPAGKPGSNRVAVLFNDITERMRNEVALREYAENLARSNEDLERYAYVSSHDLQEPLRSIVSFSQLLERRYKGKLDQDADDYINFIVEGGTRMQTLILDLLAYSRVNSKAQELRPTDVETVLASVERHLDLQLREAGAAILYDELPTVLADPLQLEQVFANLVSNAVKFRRPDEPLRVHIGARKTDGFWEFSVSDNGIGIEPEYFEKIFVIFQRLHTRETYPGTGIGLAIVKRIIDRHGGTVRVESTPGKGSTFFFTLPAA